MYFWTFLFLWSILVQADFCKTIDASKKRSLDLNSNHTDTENNIFNIFEKLNLDKFYDKIENVFSMFDLTDNKLRSKGGAVEVTTSYKFFPTKGEREENSDKRNAQTKLLHHKVIKLTEQGTARSKSSDDSSKMHSNVNTFSKSKVGNYMSGSNNLKKEAEQTPAAATFKNAVEACKRQYPSFECEQNPCSYVSCQGVPEQYQAMPTQYMNQNNGHSQTNSGSGMMQNNQQSVMQGISVGQIKPMGRLQYLGNIGGKNCKGNKNCIKPMQVTQPKLNVINVLPCVQLPCEDKEIEIEQLPVTESISFNPKTTTSTTTENPKRIFEGSNNPNNLGALCKDLKILNQKKPLPVTTKCYCYEQVANPPEVEELMKYFGKDMNNKNGNECSGINLGCGNSRSCSYDKTADDQTIYVTNSSFDCKNLPPCSQVLNKNSNQAGSQTCQKVMCLNKRETITVHKNSNENKRNKFANENIKTKCKNCVHDTERDDLKSTKRHEKRRSLNEAKSIKLKKNEVNSPPEDGSSCSCQKADSIKRGSIKSTEYKKNATGDKKAKNRTSKKDKLLLGEDDSHCSCSKSPKNKRTFNLFKSRKSQISKDCLNKIMDYDFNNNSQNNHSHTDKMLITEFSKISKDMEQIKEMIKAKGPCSVSKIQTKVIERVAKSMLKSGKCSDKDGRKTAIGAGCIN